MSEDQIVAEAIRLLAPDLKTTARYGNKGSVMFGQICPACGRDHKDLEINPYQNSGGAICIKCPSTGYEISLIWG